VGHQGRESEGKRKSQKSKKVGKNRFIYSSHGGWKEEEGLPEAEDRTGKGMSGISSQAETTSYCWEKERNWGRKREEQEAKDGCGGGGGVGGWVGPSVNNENCRIKKKKTLLRDSFIWGIEVGSILIGTVVQKAKFISKCQALGGRMIEKKIIAMESHE